MSYSLRPLSLHEVIGDKPKARDEQGEIPSVLGKLVSGQGAQTSLHSNFPIVKAGIGPESRIVFHTDPHGPGADRFRHLRMRLQGLTGNCLLITSALPQDGKSTISLNLATALAEHGKRSVLLIEADLHHPTLTQQLLLKPWPGLSDCLEGRLNVLAGIRYVDPLACYLLTAGEAQGNPSELLQSDGLTSIMQELRPSFDWILMDAPPLSPLTDAMSLARHAQASLLVVRGDRTPVSSVDQAVALLGPKHVVAMVLNGLEGLDRAYSNYYGYSQYLKKNAST